MKFMLAYKNFKKYLVMNLFTILELTISIIVMTIMISSLCVRYSYYKPFQKWFSAKGIYMYFEDAACEDMGEISIYNKFDKETLLEKFPNATDALCCYKPYLSADEDMSFVPISYDDEIITSYQPKLTQGEWFSTDSNAIEAVISKNEYGWKVGDTISLTVLGETESTIEVKIVGELEEGTKIPGGYYENTDTTDYNDFYYPYSYAIEKTPVMLFSYSALNQAQVIQGIAYKNLMIYPENTSDEVIESDIETLYNYGCLADDTLTDLHQNSVIYLREKLLNLLPILICIVIIMSVGCICVQAISTYKRLHDYAIYFINGMRWRDCLLINWIQSLYTSVASLLCSVIILKIMNVELVCSTYVILGDGAMLLLFWIISMIMPYIICHRNTPKQILTR